MGPSTRLTAAELAAAELDLESAEALLAVLGILQQQVKRPGAEVEGVELTGEELVEAWTGVSDDGNHMQIKAIRTGFSVVDNTTTRISWNHIDGRNIKEVLVPPLLWAA
jgi:hypothetical protein